MNSARSVGNFQAPRTQRRHPEKATNIVPLPSSPVDVEGISAITFHRGPKLRRPAGVQGLEVFEEAGNKRADLTARKADAVPLRQFTADLLPLAVVKETLDSHMNLQVVTIDLARRYSEQQCSGPLRHQLSRRLSTAGLAHMNGLVGDEVPVLQGDDPMLDRLLDFGRSTASETRPLRCLQLGPDPRSGQNPMPPVLLQTAQLQPYRRDRRKAGFFLPSW